VLIVVTRMNIGGPAGQVLLLAKGASTRWPTLVAAGQPPPVEGELADPDVPVLRVPLVRPLRPATDLKAFAQLRRLQRRTGARLVHTHMAKAGTIGRVAALSLGGGALGGGALGGGALVRGALGGGARPKLVHTFHGHVLAGYFGRARQRGFLELERALARHTDVLVAVSPEIRDELLGLGLGKPSQWRVVPLGLDLAPFEQVGTPAVPGGALRKAVGLGPGVPLAGVLGRLVPIKDHATLLSAVASVPGLHLAVLGDGELRGQLEARARELGISGRTHFLGWWADTPGALADLDVVALSSRNEGTPVTLIEALAAARPVVATDVGGVRHVVQPNETGWLCPAGDPAALAALLERAVFSDRDTAARLGAEGRRRARARFGAERMLAGYFSIYQELLS
jgi:glycosyltransferase involved in cell wall biosynthesis